MNILLYTSIYPIIDDESNNTSVVHYFCRSWVKAGHNVQVIHNISTFPRLYYFFSRRLYGIISSYFSVVIPNECYTSPEDYVLDGVKISRRPLLKYLPYGLFSKKKLISQHVEILKIINLNQFYPDLVIGHWENPQMQLLSLYKDDFPLIKTACVIHSKKYIKHNFFKDSLIKIDKIGFRNNGLLQCFQKSHFSDDKRFFFCPSGIPEIFNSFEYSNKLYDKHLKLEVSIIFVGLLIRRKNPIQLVEVTKLLSTKVSVNLTIIGEGNEKEKIIKCARRHGILELVQLTGKLKRFEVRDYLLQSQIFVMVSENETFGLVYLEAMACGCIVIATQGGGVDGIITHGVNGFLCKFGDLNGLNDLIISINSLSVTDKKRIIQNALRTAQKYAEDKIAESYLFNVIN